MNGRRLGIVRVSMEAVPAMLEHGAGRLPDGARVLGAHVDFFRQCLAFVVEHESYPLTLEGDELPVVALEPTWQFVEPPADEPFVRGSNE